LKNSISLFLNEKQANSIDIKDQTIKISGNEDAEKKKTLHKKEHPIFYQKSENTFKKEEENNTIKSQNIDGENDFKTYGK